MNNDYWRANLKILSILLLLWFLVSFGFGILWSDFLDQYQIGGFKVGFWFAQQGSIYFFVLLIFVYIYLMNKLDKKYFPESEEDEKK
jgi:putative solute:sodium symporter small subunit